MNAPTQAANLAPPQVELIALASITQSDTAMQVLRRKGYNAVALEELAASIRADGVLMPILVRPLAHDRNELPKYELVVGERRWQASAAAGLEYIPARIMPLTDGQVLKAQLVENLQREGLDPLAEAEGYRELIAGGINADVIGDMIGLSRSYVYARTQLLAIAPAVKEALRAGEITASQALLFARVPGEKLQDQALKVLRNWSYQGHGEPLSFRRTAEIFKDKAKGLLIPLATVPFRLDDTSFHTFGPKQGKHQAQDVIALPACLACPKRSGNDAELLAALDDPNVCTDRLCHDVKAKQSLERRKQAAADAGREILTGDAAAAILPGPHGTRGFIDLDEPCDDDDFPEDEPEQGKDETDEAYDVRYGAWDERASKWASRSYRQLLGGAVAQLEITLAQDPKRKRLRELVPDKAVAKALAEKGIKLRIYRDASKPAKAPKPQDPEARRRAEEKEAQDRAAAEFEQKVESTYLERLLQVIHEKWKGPLKRDDLELVAEHVTESWDAQQIVGRLLKKKPSLGALGDRDLGGLLVAVVLGLAYEGNGDRRGLLAAARRLKIDAKALEKTVRAELSGKTAPHATTKGKKK